MPRAKHRKKSKPSRPAKPRRGFGGHPVGKPRAKCSCGAPVGVRRVLGVFYDATTCPRCAPAGTLVFPARDGAH